MEAMKEWPTCSECGGKVVEIRQDAVTVKTVAQGAPQHASWMAAHGMDSGYTVEVPVRYDITEICENGHHILRWERPKHRNPA